VPLLSGPTFTITDWLLTELELGTTLDAAIELGAALEITLELETTLELATILELDTELELASVLALLAGLEDEPPEPPQATIVKHAANTAANLKCCDLINIMGFSVNHERLKNSNIKKSYR